MTHHSKGSEDDQSIILFPACRSSRIFVEIHSDSNLNRYACANQDFNKVAHVNFEPKFQHPIHIPHTLITC